jgi:Predicted membrane protein
MKFLSTYLQPGEEILYRARIHYFLFAQPLCLLSIGGFILWDVSTPMMKWLGITVLFLGLVSLVQRIFVKVGSLFVVTNRRVVLKTGIVRRRVTELVLSKCEGIQATESVTGRIFGYGTLVITTGGMTNCYYYVSNPFCFKMEINRQIQ